MGPIDLPMYSHVPIDASFVPCIPISPGQHGTSTPTTLDRESQLYKPSTLLFGASKAAMSKTFVELHLTFWFIWFMGPESSLVDQKGIPRTLVEGPGHLWIAGDSWAWLVSAK